MRFLRLVFFVGAGFAVACSSGNLQIAPGADTSATDDTGTSSDGGSSDTSGGDSTGSDTRGDDVVSSDGTAGDGVSGDAILGDGGKPDGPICDRTTFPTFVRGCTNDESCSFGLHALDCCGSMTAIGFNHSEKTRFDTAEKAYEAACPIACGCAAAPISTDTGLTTTDPSKIVVTCVFGATGLGECKTTVK